jgi:hypothetical protein
VDTDGTVTAILASPRDNGYIGVFEIHLPKERFAELRAAIERADLRSMKDDYPPRGKAHDLTRVMVSIDDAAGHKEVRATSASPLSPRSLRLLIDPMKRLEGSMRNVPAGLLSELIAEASRHPVAAISTRLEAPRVLFHPGEDIAIDIIVKNVGTMLVVLPSPNCMVIASGYLAVYLRHTSLPVEEMATGIDFTEISFGPPMLKFHHVLSDAAREDLQHVVRIEPGREWRIRMPRPLRALSPGRYEAVGQFSIDLLYPRSVLTSVLGAGLVSGWNWPSSLQFTVAE